MKKQSAILLGLLFCAALFAREYKITGEKPANWWTLGEQVVFKGPSPLPEEESVTGSVVDIFGNEIVRKTVSAAEFNESGWRWTPDAPGFRRVRFSFRDGSAATNSFPSQIVIQDPSTREFKNGPGRIFPMEYHDFTVTEGILPPANEISPVFSTSMLTDFAKKELPLARAVGFRNLRMHTVNWSDIEPEKGVFKWEKLDEIMKAARENGYPDENIVFNVIGTPRWASTHPEADWKNICFYEYAAFRPKEMADWENFLRQICRRYPGVKRFEVWNEMSLPYASCFWADSVGNFALMLKTAYRTIKEEKPDGTVILGGISSTNTYMSFYEQLLKTCGRKYYDVFSLRTDDFKKALADYHAIDKRLNMPETPVINTEWSCIPLHPSDEKFASEQLLTKKMLFNLLKQVREGVGEVYFFTLLNINYWERESLEFFRENRCFTMHVSGLFREQPYIQPRYAAAAIRHLISLTRGKLTVRDGYVFGADAGQQAILLESESGPLLILWNANEKAQTISPELLRAAGSESKLTTPDGTPAALTGGLQLQPEIYYLLTKPDMSVVNPWKNKADVLLEPESLEKEENIFNGNYRRGKLFDRNFNLVRPENLARQELSRYVPLKGTTGKSPIRAWFAAALDKDAMELLFEVEDPIQFPKSGFGCWEGDSVQFSIDTQGNGRNADRVEFAAVLGKDGTAELWKVFAVDIGANLPMGYTGKEQIVPNCRLKFNRSGNRTIYRIHLNMSELFPLVPSEDCRLRFAALVNNNDGMGRASYLEWGGGIGLFKKPAWHGNLTRQVDRKDVLNQNDFQFRGWNLDYRLTMKDGVVRVDCDSPVCSGIYSKRTDVVPGAAYRISVELRGNAKIEGIITGEGVKRAQAIEWTPLQPGWQKFEYLWFPSKGSRNFNAAIYAWGKQDGAWFEVRNFKVEIL